MHIRYGILECTALLTYFWCILSANILLLSSAECMANGDVQLTGYGTESEGIVEICYNSIWGLVCDDGFAPEVPEVVCKQLGYFTGKSYVYRYT